MNDLRISERFESTLTAVVSLLCLALLVVGLGSMLSAPAQATLHEVRLDDVVITKQHGTQVARNDAPAAVQTLVQ